MLEGKRGAEYLQTHLMQPDQRKIEVSVREQLLKLYEGEDILEIYPISTSKFGLGSEEGSYKTPLGKFRVGEKIGDDAPANTIFKSREPVGCWCADEASEDDLVLSRILWLDGEEEANANTKERYIYIHGTNHEGDIGQPRSYGCVRMRNQDVMQLYALVPLGTPVEIFA